MENNVNFLLPGQNDSGTPSSFIAGAINVVLFTRTKQDLLPPKTCVLKIETELLFSRDLKCFLEHLSRV